MRTIIREPEFAKRVRNMRRSIDLSQTECASQLGITRQYWNNWEGGYCKPKDKRLAQVAELLRVDPHWLQHGDGSELEEKMKAVARSMRLLARDLDHIRKAIAK